MVFFFFLNLENAVVAFKKCQIKYFVIILLATSTFTM